MSFNDLFKIYVQVFFLLTPFCIMSVFLSVTSSMEKTERKALVLRNILATSAIVLIFFFVGKYLFTLFGITLDAFRAGAGAILFLTAVALVTGKMDEIKATDEDDIAVVPLAIPLTVGPGTIGALMVMSISIEGALNKFLVSVVLLFSALSVGLLIFIANSMNRILGKKFLSALSRITGLILGALSAQLIFDGIRGFVGSLA